MPGPGKNCNNTITKDPATPSVSLHYLVKCLNVSLIAPLVSGVASLSASFSSKADTLNIWCKSCRMWQLLWTITETINTLFPVVNFLKCVVTEVVLSSIVAFKTFGMYQSAPKHAIFVQKIGKFSRSGLWALNRWPLAKILNTPLRPIHVVTLCICCFYCDGRIEYLFVFLRFVDWVSAT